MGSDDAEAEEETFLEHRETTFVRWLLSASFSKRTVFYIVSVLICLFQTAMLISDIMFHYYIKNHRFPSHRHTEAILIFQVVNFYWSAFATVYFLQAGNRQMGYLSLASVFFNLTIFSARFGYEFMIIKFRAEEY